MTAVQAILVLLGFAAWIAFILTFFVTYNNFRVRLQTHHSETWVALGRPEFTQWHSGLNWPWGDHWPLHSYLHRRKYLSLCDGKLSRLGNRFLFMEILLHLIMAVVAYLIVGLPAALLIWMMIILNFVWGWRR